MISDVLSDAMVLIKEYQKMPGVYDCTKTEIDAVVAVMDALRIVFDTPPNEDEEQLDKLLKTFWKRFFEESRGPDADLPRAVCDPDILDGMPVVEGTRVPIHDVAASLAKGISMERVLEAYPSLTQAQAEACYVFVHGKKL